MDFCFQSVAVIMVCGANAAFRKAAHSTVTDIARFRGWWLRPGAGAP